MAADRKECSFSFPPLPPLFSFLILENHNMVLCFEHPRGNEAKIFWHQTKAYVCSCQLILSKGLRSYSWALILKNNLLHQFFILPIHTKGLMHLLLVSWLSGSGHLCLPTVPCLMSYLTTGPETTESVPMGWNHESDHLSPFKLVFLDISLLRKSLTLRV